MPDQPGRSCPLHYRYAPTVFATRATVTCEVLYVVGGVYGNPLALNAVFAAFAVEAGTKHLIFNGDFNWFNVDPEQFQRLNAQVLHWPATRGNVETELGATGGAAAPGGAYPAWVDDGTAARSNVRACTPPASPLTRSPSTMRRRPGNSVFSRNGPPAVTPIPPTGHASSMAPRILQVRPFPPRPEQEDAWRRTIIRMIYRNLRR
jgi:hypothetical protein